MPQEISALPCPVQRVLKSCGFSGVLTLPSACLRHFLFSRDHLCYLCITAPKKNHIAEGDGQRLYLCLNPAVEQSTATTQSGHRVLWPPWPVLGGCSSMAKDWESCQHFLVRGQIPSAFLWKKEAACTWMGKQGGALAQLVSQSISPPKGTLAGVSGLKSRSWSTNWPHCINMRDLCWSIRICSGGKRTISLDTCRTCRDGGRTHWWEIMCMNGCTQLWGHLQKFAGHFLCFADKKPQICLCRKVSLSPNALC